ncbi:MAG TPA: hypothetical protein VEL31_20210 [Ktedonobacteraceae bacterium]|nr:hypothetical protein [Ktedonobacteraceae bacterium]
MSEQPGLHTMQVALALSPTNKACTTTLDGDMCIVQEHAYEHYRLWIVSPKDIPLWAGMLSERDIDRMPEKYHVDPGKRVWSSLGIAPDYQSIEAAIQALAGEMMHLRTELFIIKDMLLEKASESEH